MCRLSVSHRATSAARHAVTFDDSLTGEGNLPCWTQVQIVLLETGMRATRARMRINPPSASIMSAPRTLLLAPFDASCVRQAVYTGSSRTETVKFDLPQGSTARSSSALELKQSMPPPKKQNT